MADVTMCGIPEGWLAFVKAKCMTLSIQGTHLQPRHLVFAGKMAVIYQDTKIFQILLNRTRAV